MEVLKLAFDTVMIGLFALPRLLVMIDLEQPDLLNSSNMKRLTAYLPAELRPPAIARTLFSLVYLLASWITPVSREFLNDPDMLGKWLPTEEKIQAFNYKQRGAPMNADRAVPAKIEPVSRPDSSTGSFNAADVNAQFRYEESTLLLRASDGSERLNRLHEQLNMLQAQHSARLQ